jgi:hypothetical protein
MRIGPDALDVLHLTDSRALANTLAKPVARVTLEACLPVHRCASLGEHLIDGIRVLRWRQLPDPVAHALDRRVVDGHRCDAGAERGTEVPLVNRCVVAVPVQVHPFPWRLVPERRKVRGTDQL